MKIGYDGKRMTQNRTGLGNYSRYLVRLLTKLYPANSYTIYALKPPAAEMHIEGVDYRYGPGNLFNAYWRSFGIINDLKADHVDLFHGLSNEIPFGLKKAGIPSVVTVHDLIFIRYPHYYPLIDRLIYKQKVRYATSSAVRIVAISNQTRDDLVNYFGVEKDRIKVIYQNCDPVFYNKVSDERQTEIRLKYNLPAEYILNVGTIEERKNLLLVIKALKEVPDIDLVVVGRDTPYAETVRQYISNQGLVERVHFLKNVDHKDLPGIYQLAKLFIYPSRFEGFGIPIVEALHSGVPVIAAKGSCLEEAGGYGSIYIDPDDDTGLARHICTVLNDGDKKNTMIQAGYEHLKNFSDDKIATQTMELYKDVLNHA
jgi:glycosyltransferase involved in cell wall biosynthesis